MKSNRKRISFLFLVVTSSLFLTACGSSGFYLGSRLGIKIPIEEIDSKAENESSEDSLTSEPLVFSQLDNNQNEVTETQQTQSQQFIGSGNFIAQKPLKKPNLSKDIEGKINLNFDAFDLGIVANIILKEELQLNYIINPKVSGTVTLHTTRGLHKEELLPILEMLLSVNDAVLVKSNGIYRIEPKSQALHSANTSLPNRKKPDGYQISIIPLKFVGAADMAEIIQPVVPANTIIKIDLARNILMVAGTRAELERVLDLVNTFDLDFFAGLSFGLFLLENTEVDNTLAEIEKIFINGEKSPISGMLRFISIKHLNAILVVSQQKAYLKKAEQWIKRLDVQNGVNGEGGIVVYRVQHVDALDLADTLNEIISGSSSSRQSAASVAPGQRIATISNKKNTNKKKSKRRKGSSAGNASLEGVTIIADEPNNALVILAEPQQYRILNKIIKQLDVMPLQVLIDATIISVDLNDNLKYGVQWSINSKDRTLLAGAPQPNVIGTIAEAVGNATTGGVFSYSKLTSKQDITATITALAENGKINVLSAPSLMVLNNHEATIKVGNSIPVRTSQQTNTSGGGSVNDLIQTSNIEMRDTGVTLTVKPRVNANGVVILEIEQNVDNATETTSSNIDSPTILQRQIASTVAVTNGESLVLGGLISETHTQSNNGIPILKEIPYLGVLFGSKVETVVRSELIVIITPRVVENKFDNRKVTDEFKRRLSGIYYDPKKYQLKNSEVLRDYRGAVVKTYN